MLYFKCKFYYVTNHQKTHTDPICLVVWFQKMNMGNMGGADLDAAGYDGELIHASYIILVFDYFEIKAFNSHFVC